MAQRDLHLDKIPKVLQQQQQLHRQLQQLRQPHLRTLVTKIPQYFRKLLAIMAPNDHQERGQRFLNLFIVHNLGIFH